MSDFVTQPVTFTPQQQDVLRALAAGASKIDAAQAANVHRDTANRWEHNVPGFREAVLEAQAGYRASLASQVRRLSMKAVDQLESLLDHPDTPPSVRLRAIQLVLTRPRFPDKEWALPESLQPAPIQKVQESMALIEAETKSMLQYDKLKASNVENVEHLREHFPVTRHLAFGASFTSRDSFASNSSFASGENNVESVENVESGTDGLSAGNPQSDSSNGPSAIARNAPCPCGSGLKYKRCCGKAAPPLLQTQAMKAA